MEISKEVAIWMITVSAHMEMLVKAEIFRSIRSSTGGIWGMFLCTGFTSSLAFSAIDLFIIQKDAAVFNNKILKLDKIREARLSSPPCGFCRMLV